jgi:acetaldehyde dehydrogenase
MRPKIRVAVIGTGNIGTDLVERLLRDQDFEVVAFVGRRPSSPGLLRMKGKVEHILSGGIQELKALAPDLDGFFDATSAFDHMRHWRDLKDFGLWAVDLTPSKVGRPIVPELIGRASPMKLESQKSANFSMVTCGGQSSAPLLHAITEHSSNPIEVEVSSSIASLSAGPATRANMEEYINATESLITLLTPGVSAKAILVLNPADPPVMMRTTVTVRAEAFDLDAIVRESEGIVANVRAYVPGYQLALAPYYLGSGAVSATVRVVGEGYYLPKYSGNLDIINAAAVETARRHTRMAS